MPPPLTSLPHSELVIHVGSLSKVFAHYSVRLHRGSSTIIQTITEDILLMIDQQGNNITELTLADLMQRQEIEATSVKK